VSLRGAAAAAAATLSFASLAYAAVALGALEAFRRRPDVRTASPAPDVTILVPLFGAEPGLEQNLRAFAAQESPAAVQLVLGVHDAGDAALPIAEAVRAAFPERVTLSVGAPRRVANPKVANLLAMLAHARHETLVLADSDMRAGPGYLRTVCAPLGDPAVGAVTCLYAGVADGGFAARLGAAFVNEQFAPSALVASVLAPLRHAYGATIALRRATLEAAGGLAALGPHLADDHVLGARVAALGLRVVLAREVPHTRIADRDLAALWRHELRWHRTIRAVQPSGYATMFLTYPLPLALAGLAFAPRSRGARAVLIAAAGMRVLLARRSARAFGVRPSPAWLVPFRDAFGFAVWARGLAGGPVDWRGEEFMLGAGDLLDVPEGGDP
jgi:ceramide glucosyltransferase